jgi:hypothetical protein
MHQKMGIFSVEWFEEGKSHKMIPMGVGEKKVDIERLFFNKFVSESANSGPCINRNDIVAFGSNLQTGGITTVFKIRFARNRNGTPRSPACDLHLEPSKRNFFLKLKDQLTVEKETTKTRNQESTNFNIVFRVFILSCFRGKLGS